MNDDHADAEAAKSGAKRMPGAEFQIEENFENSPLYGLLKVNADNAHATIARLTRAERTARREIVEVRQLLSDELVKHEKTRGDSRESIARLQEINVALSEKYVEVRRLSAVAVLIAWVGTVLVAAGVNVLTGDNHQILGLMIVLIGAAVDIAAFYIRRPST